MFKNLKNKLFNLLSKLTWSDLSGLAKNKIVNRTYIYLIIVPIIAKLFSQVKSPVIIEYGKTYIVLNLELPFNWVLFYLSALCFSLGTVIYYWKAPSIVKENNSYGEFENNRKTFAHIFNYYSQLGIRNTKQEELPESIESQWLRLMADANILGAVQLLQDYIRNINPINAEKINGVIRLLWSKKHKYPQEINQTSFWMLFRYGNRTNTNFIYLSFILFLIGLLLILYIIIESFITVVNLIF